MAYKSKTIFGIISDIEGGKVYLPALQRKFVWDKRKIELLFDSLMRNYPIGTFLFWNLKKEVANTYVFYEFLRAYDQRHPYNIKKPGNFTQPEIIGVLDGQQRLSSMYIGLQGTHTEKMPHKHHASDAAYRNCSLYLNLLTLPYTISEENIVLDEERNYDFLFLTEWEAANWVNRHVKFINDDGLEQTRSEPLYWFKVGNILAWNDDPEIDFIIDGFISKAVDEEQKIHLIKNKRFIGKALGTLHKRIFSDELINYFEVAKNDLEDILKIFVRVNSGGVALSKTDLLFSTIVATWSDGRQEIENLLKRINRKGDGFVFGNDFLMRSCLVLTDSPVLFKVNSFKTENVEKIRDEWVRIATAIETTVDLLVGFGFNGQFLTSQNSIIIIAYHIYKGGKLDSDSKLSIKKYLIHALLNRIYGSAQDQLIASLRNFLRVEKNQIVEGSVFELRREQFSFNDLLNISLPGNKSLYISESQLDNFLSYRKGADSFFVLSLLYPNLKYMEVLFHQDHIHPASRFSDREFDEMGIGLDERTEWRLLRDTLPNLQIMEGRDNVSKNATPFLKWLSSKEVSYQSHFKVSNFIPDGQTLEFANFRRFYEARRDFLKMALKGVLAINSSGNSSQLDDLSLGGILDEE